MPRSVRRPSSEAKTKKPAASGLSMHLATTLLFALLLFTYAYIHQLAGANQNSRLDLLHAVFQRGSLVIDANHRNTIDKALFKGHYYSEKAPAITVLAMPAFAVSRAMLGLSGLSVDSRSGWWISDWMTTVGSVGLLTAAGGAALFAFLAKKTSRKAALVTTLALFLGAAPLPYATCLFPHAAVVGLFCIALWLLEREAPPSGWSALCAGFCAGLATAGEFTAAPAAVGFFLWSALKGRRSCLPFVAGAIAPLLLIPAYNWAAFGSPLVFGYKLSTTFGAMHRQGFFGITFPPSPGKLFFLLISPQRGLFFWTPFLFLIFAGYGELRRRCSRPVFLISVLVPVIHTILIAAFLSWGGSALGPRYLSSILPFLALPAAFGWKRDPQLGTILAALSIVLTGLGTAVNALPDLLYINPLVQLYLPSLLSGHLAPNIASAAGLHGILSLVPLALILALGTTVLWKYWATLPSSHAKRARPTN